MKVNLYDKIGKEIPNLATFSDRCTYINDNIFSQSKYKDYYGLLHEDTSEEVCNAYNDRWIGVKKVGQKFKNESVKHFLNSLGTYLLSSRDYSIKLQIKEYNELKYKTALTNIEKDRLNELENNVLFHKIINGKPFTFMVNDDCVKFLQKSYNYYSNILSNCGYSLVFHKRLVNIHNNLLITFRSVEECKSICENIKSYQHYTQKLSTEIKKLYTNREKDVDIKPLVCELIEVRDNIRHLESKIVDIYDDYITATEFIYKV